jgi:uncharacterized protein involved in type VI secretion and phage assembly
MDHRAGQAAEHHQSMDHEMVRHRSRLFGKYRGLVQSNSDDQSRGRLQVIVPQIGKSVLMWALPCVPYAGPQVGLFALPPVGAMVWIEFEAGNVSFPIWTGCLWGQNDIDPNDAKPTIKFLKTDKFVLRIDDDAGEIRIAFNGGDPSGGTQILMHSSDLTLGSASVKVQASGRTIDLDSQSVRVNTSSLEVL